MPDNVRTTTENSVAPTSVAPYKDRAFDLYLTYCALGGMMVTDQGGIKAMSLGEFCQLAGIDEKTTWRWKHQIPDFAMQVRKRREEVVPLARETAAFNRLFLIGMTSLPTGFKEVVNQKTGAVRRVPTGALHDDQRAAVDALKTYTGHFSDLHMPTVKQEVKFEGNFLDMMTAAARDGIIEGEVVDAEQQYTNNAQPQTDAAGSAQDPGALPGAS